MPISVKVYETAYLAQGHKTVRKVAFLGVRKMRVLSKSREKIVHFDLDQTENCMSQK